MATMKGPAKVITQSNVYNGSPDEKLGQCISDSVTLGGHGVRCCCNTRLVAVGKRGNFKHVVFTVFCRSCMVCVLMSVNIGVISYFV